MAAKNIDFVRVLLKHLTKADREAVRALPWLYAALQMKPNKVRIKPCTFTLRRPDGRQIIYKGRLTDAHCVRVRKAVPKGYDEVMQVLGDLLEDVDAPIASCLSDLPAALTHRKFGTAGIGACYFNTNQCHNLSQSQCAGLNPTRPWVNGTTCGFLQERSHE